MSRWRAFLLYCLDLHCGVIVGVLMQAALREFGRPDWFLMIAGPVAGMTVVARLRWGRE